MLGIEEVGVGMSEEEEVVVVVGEGEEGLRKIYRVFFVL